VQVLATNGDAKCEKRSWEWIIVTDGETAADNSSQCLLNVLAGKQVSRAQK